MATQLFREGEHIWVEADRVQTLLASGWDFNDPNGPAIEHPAVIFPVGMNLESLPMEEAEAKVLEAMGIMQEPITHLVHSPVVAPEGVSDLSRLDPANRKDEVAPIAVVAPQKRKYTRRTAK